MTEPAPPRPGEPPRALAAYLLLVVAMVSWAGNMVVGRAVEGVVPPIGLSFTRWLVALVAILPFAARELWVKRRVIRANWRIILLLGLLGLTGSNTLTYLGLTYTTAINGALVTSVTPVTMLLAAFALDRERPQRNQLFGIVASLIGVVIIVAHGDIATLLRFHANPGDLLILLSVSSWSVYSVLLRRRPREISPVGLLALLFMVGAATILPLHLIFETAAGREMPFTPPTLAAYLYVGLFPAVIAFMAWNRAIIVIGPARAAVFNHLMPLFVAVLAFVFLGEQLAAYHLVGAAVIFLGIFLASR